MGQLYVHATKIYHKLAVDGLEWNAYRSSVQRSGFVVYHRAH